MSVALVTAHAYETHIKAAVAAYQAGTVAVRQHEFQTAVTCFQKAIEIEPTFMESRKSLVRAYLDSGQRLQAARAITELLEIEPSDFRDRLVLGQILLQQKQPQPALAQFSLVLQEVPLNADGLLGFATAAKLLGMNDRAQDALQLGRKHYPHDNRFQSQPGSEKQN
jgi:tetratricopeptide (TPR) repeat protein